MEVLIQIKEENGQQLVSGRELHKKLEIKSRYNDWIKNAIKNYGFINIQQGGEQNVSNIN